MTEFSYQLYSSRNFPPLADTLRMVADLGYRQVEGYGALFTDPALLAELKAALEDTGLTMPTAHFGLDMVQSAPEKVLEITKDLGIGTVFVPHIGPEERPSNAEGWSAFGAMLARVGVPFWDAGLSFGWHNHDFEFADLGAGARPLACLLDADRRLALEFDVAWAVVGGQDPLYWIQRYADRLISAHVKDIAAEGSCLDEDGWADVGHGVMDWPRLMTALREAGTEVFVMEHDNPSDDRRFADRSLAAAKGF